MDTAEIIQKITEQKQILLDGYQQILLLSTDLDQHYPSRVMEIIKSTLQKHNEK
jgi:hypothetical protein